MVNFYSGDIVLVPQVLALDSFYCSYTLIVQFQQETNSSKLTVKLEKRYEIGSMLTIKTTKQSHWRHYVFFINFEHIS